MPAEYPTPLDSLHVARVTGQVMWPVPQGPSITAFTLIMNYWPPEGPLRLPPPPKMSDSLNKKKGELEG